MSGEYDTSWLNDSACDASTAEYFTPHFRESPSERVAREKYAKQLCGGCVVRAACLSFALNSGLVDNKDGVVWGGLNSYERTTINRRKSRSRRAG